MITRRKIVLALGAGALAPITSFAQQQGRVWRIGVYSLSADTPRKKASFSDTQKAFGEAASYADWKFVYAPPMLSRGFAK